MNRLFSFLGKACEADTPGSVSSMRVISLLGCFAILFVLLLIFAVASYHERKVAEIPSSVGATLGSYFLALLGANVGKTLAENKTPPSP